MRFSFDSTMLSGLQLPWYEKKHNVFQDHYSVRINEKSNNIRYI